MQSNQSWIINFSNLQTCAMVLFLFLIIIELKPNLLIANCNQFKLKSRLLRLYFYLDSLTSIFIPLSFSYYSFLYIEIPVYLYLEVWKPHCFFMFSSIYFLLLRIMVNLILMRIIKWPFHSFFSVKYCQNLILEKDCLYHNL